MKGTERLNNRCPSLEIYGGGGEYICQSMLMEISAFVLPKTSSSVPIWRGTSNCMCLRRVSYSSPIPLPPPAPSHGDRKRTWAKTAAWRGRIFCC